MELQTTQLNNNIRISTDVMKDVESITIGVWVGVGSRYETPENNGVSHFLEHMMFKGTKTRSAFDIVNEIESVGGIMNAHTSREVTAYYIKILKKDLPLAVDILTDILQNSQFETSEIEREREVIIQEIAQSHDTPDDIIFDYFQETAFQNQSLGRPILGSKQNVLAFKNADFNAYIDQHYHGQNVVFSAAGNINHDELVTLLEDKLANKSAHKILKSEAGQYIGGEKIVSKDIEQSHMIMGFEGISMHHPLYFAQSVFSTLFGGGMSSRLFQEIREKRGLAYSVFCYAGSYTGTGVFGMYAATPHDKINELKTVMQGELETISESLKEEEIHKAKQQLMASKAMALESTMARGEHSGYDTLFFNRVRDVAEFTNAIETVSKQDIETLIAHYLNSKQTYTLLGNII